jgi:tight adherence protein C
VILLVALPLAVAPFAIGANVMMSVLLMAWAVIAGWALPVWYVHRRAYLRQERIRRSVPDALDLLVVCIEAGVSLDAAILRVARELSKVHPVLSSELMVVNRKSNAGVPREQALRGLWERTGVEEVRALISTMIQSEKWGTSIGTVLQVYAETLRRKRRQAIEKKAATIPVKMLFPLILFILPALFAVVMGPAVIQIPKLFKMGQ